MRRVVGVHDVDIRRLILRIGELTDKLDAHEAHVEILWRHFANAEENRQTVRIPTDSVTEAIAVADADAAMAELDVLRQRVAGIDQERRRWLVWLALAVAVAIVSTLVLRELLGVFLAR